MSQYSLEFQEKTVAKLLHPEGPSVIQLSKESGISKSSLYKWLRKFRDKSNSNQLQLLDNNMTTEQDNNTKIPIRPQNWSAADKLLAVNKTFTMSEDEKGAYCRENGIYSNHLAEWHSALIDGIKPSANKEHKVENLKLKSKIKSLESELRRKEKALAETAALLILKKKANLIWGEEKDD